MGGGGRGDLGITALIDRCAFKHMRHLSSMQLLNKFLDTHIHSGAFGLKQNLFEKHYFVALPSEESGANRLAQHGFARGLA